MKQNLKYPLLAAALMVICGASAPSTIINATIVTGGVFQQYLSAGIHSGCLIKSAVGTTDTLYIHLGSAISANAEADAASATTSNSFSLGPAQPFLCSAGGNPNSVGNNISVMMATTGDLVEGSVN